MDTLTQCTNRDRLLQLLQSEGKSTAAEIGVARGGFSEKILKCWPNCRSLYLVDLWKFQPSGYVDGCNASDEDQQGRYELVLRRLRCFNGRFTVIRDWSHKAAEGFADGSLEFVYIDANHSYTTAAQDLHCWFPKVASGGIFSGHDYFNGDLRSYGVKKAVDEFAVTQGLFVHQTSENVVNGVWEGISWMIRKP